MCFIHICSPGNSSAIIGAVVTFAVVIATVIMALVILLTCIKNEAFKSVYETANII